MGVKEIEEGKYGRVEVVNPDPLKVTCKRGAKKREKESSERNTGKICRSKSRVKLLKCVSMWKNPMSQTISLEMRAAHDRFRSIQPEINLREFGELKSLLDNAEHHYSQDVKKKAIGEESAEEPNEIQVQK
ncbi:SKIP/SNW domain-containing protein [Encephalitozoon hellem]|nr:SKIP/SNW domain-containing protein [Encephalitozoon hellem]